MPHGAPPCFLSETFQNILLNIPDLLEHSRTFFLFHAPSINTRNSFRTFSVTFRTPLKYHENFRTAFGTSFLHIFIYITQPKILSSLKCVTRRVRIYTDMHRKNLSGARSISGHLTHTIMLPE